MQRIREERYSFLRRENGTDKDEMGEVSANVSAKERQTERTGGKRLGCKEKSKAGAHVHHDVKTG